MLILQGSKVSTLIKEQLHKQVKAFKRKHKRVPGLAVILVGNNEASSVYVRHKVKACKEVGFYSLQFNFKTTVKSTTLKKTIDKLNKNKKIDGILVQLPLPSSLSRSEILSWINPKKDPDGLTLQNQALLWQGHPCVVPCTAKGVMTLLKYYKLPVNSKRVVVIGRSLIVGLPLFNQLVNEDATVTLCHSKTKNLRQYTKQSDMVFVCAGKKGLLQKNDFKKGAVVVDIGIHRDNNKLTGDVKVAGLNNWIKALSPVPNGIGPMTIVSLLQNTFELAKLNIKQMRK